VRTEKNLYYSFEGYINGEYKKITNNDRFIDNTVDTRVFTAFTHFTWDVSNEKYMVTDH
jgi:hypothetical protein